MYIYMYVYIYIYIEIDTHILYILVTRGHAVLPRQARGLRLQGSTFCKGGCNETGCSGLP